jgi:hypothetical protein
MVYANHKNGKVGDGGSYCLTNIRGTNLVKRKARLARKTPLWQASTAALNCIAAATTLAPTFNPRRPISGTYRGGCFFGVALDP